MTAASRRFVLTALAAMPVGGVPALADVAATGEPDPIFSLIDAARLARARLYEVLDVFNELEELELSNKLDEQHRELLADVEEKESQCCGALYYAENAILGTKLCTHAGVATQLIFAADRYSANEVDEYLIPLLVNAARVIDNAVVSKIGLSDQLARRLSEDQAEIES
jgi:hypothetical protein